MVASMGVGGSKTGVVVLASLLISVSFISYTTADASEPVEIGEGLFLRFAPESLTLSSGETGTFEVRIENQNDHPIYVLIMVGVYLIVGASSPRVTEGYVEVRPTATRSVDVTVTSNARAGQGESASDVTIWLYWSTQDDPDMRRNDTVEGSWTGTYDVVDRSVNYGLYIAIVLIVVPTSLIVIFYAIHKRTHERGGEDISHQGEMGR